MSFKYKVLELTTNSISVEFQDGSIAEVDIFKSDSKEDIDSRVAQFYHPLDAEERFSSVESIPFKVGEEVTAKKVSDMEEAEPTPEPEPEKESEAPPVAQTSIQEKEVYTYKDLRKLNYPGVRAQLYAMYRHREGDADAFVEIDKQYKAADELYPETMPDMTPEEYRYFLEDLSEI